VQSIRSIRIDQVPHVAERGIDFELGVLLGEAPSIGKAHIRD
jgi:hypothetical protein